MKANGKKRAIDHRPDIKKNGLNLRQQRFIMEYLVDGIGAQAVIRAGYSAVGASATAARLLAIPAINSRIAQRLSKSPVAAALSVDRVEQEIARLAFSDPRKLYAPDGSLLPVTELDDDTAASVASVETKTAKRTKTAKIKLWSKTEALTLAARRLGMLQDRMVVSGQITLGMMVDASMGKAVQLPGDDAKIIDGEVQTEDGDGQSEAPSNDD